MQSEKESFVFYRSFFEALQDLKDKDRLRVYDAICRLALNEKDTQLTGIAKTVFTLIRPQILSNTKKYKDGQKGGRPKKETTGFEKGKTTGYSQKKPNVNDNDNDNVNDNDLLSNKKVEELQKIIIETLGSTNLTVIQEAVTYLDELPLEVIKEALTRTARKQKKWDYARGTLNNWLEEGLDTLEKLEVKDLEFRGRGVLQEETEEQKKARKIRELEEAMKNGDS